MICIADAMHCIADAHTQTQGVTSCTHNEESMQDDTTKDGDGIKTKTETQTHGMEMRYGPEIIHQHGNSHSVSEYSHCWTPCTALQYIE